MSNYPTGRPKYNWETETAWLKHGSIKAGIFPTQMLKDRGVKNLSSLPFTLYAFKTKTTRWIMLPVTESDRFTYFNLWANDHLYHTDGLNLYKIVDGFSKGASSNLHKLKDFFEGLKSVMSPPKCPECGNRQYVEMFNFFHPCSRCRPQMQGMKLRRDQLGEYFG